MKLISLIDKLPRHATRHYRSRKISELKRIVIHHTAGTQSVEEIARYHIASNQLAEGGAPGIAYHYVIGQDGTIYKCWPASTVTWCVAGYNSSSLCVALIGNFETMIPAPEQWAMAVRLVRNLKMAFGITEIKGHKELNPTACPGRNFDLDLFRKEVEQESADKEGGL